MSFGKDYDTMGIASALTEGITSRSQRRRQAPPSWTPYDGRSSGVVIKDNADLFASVEEEINANLPSAPAAARAPARGRRQAKGKGGAASSRARRSAKRKAPVLDKFSSEEEEEEDVSDAETIEMTAEEIAESQPRKAAKPAPQMIEKVWKVRAAAHCVRFSHSIICFSHSII